MKNNGGFTLMEILTVVGILAIIATMTFYFFGGLSRREVLEKDVASLTAFVRDARNLAVSGKNASAFGVHFDQDKAVVFPGLIYSPSNPQEKVFYFSDRVYMSALALNGGGSDIVFSRLSGETNNYGTVTLSLKNYDASTTITILKTGVVK